MRILRKLKIREISSVDRPAQIGASVVLLKRHEPQPTGEPTVTDKNTPTLESIAKQLADTQAELAIAKAELVIAKALGGLSDAEKAHLEKLDAGRKAEFVQLDAAGRKTELAKATDSNPVIYKSEKGIEFRKNDDPRLVEMAKELDAETKVRKANDEKIGRVALEKRAGDELPKLPGTMDVKVALLKAVDSITDQPTRDGALALLKAGNAAISGVFDTKGVLGGPDESPVAKLETLAKARAVEKKISRVDAYVQVSDENPELYAQAVNAKA